jgi:hypothetical protein
MKPRLGSLILFSSRIEDEVAFYRSLGVPLEPEVHDEDGPIHYACDLDGAHIALYESSPGEAPNCAKAGALGPASSSTTLKRF